MPITFFLSRVSLRKSILRLLTLSCLILLVSLPLFSTRQTSRAAKQEGQNARPAPGADSQGRAVGYRSPKGKHKLRVTDPKLAEQLWQNGARMIADYGSFQVFSADEKTIRAVRQNAGLSFSDEDNLILLNAGTLDTTETELQQQRASSARFAEGESSLHLVQFAGPIKPEWLEALEKTGVKVISYVPNNAYLVYGQDRALAKMSAWALRSDYVQWDGEYKSDYKLDPGIHNLSRGDFRGTNDGNELFAVQLVADGNGNQTTLQTIANLRVEPIRSQFRALNYINVIVKLPIQAVERQLNNRPDVVSISRYVVPVKFDERQNTIITGNLTGNSPAPGDYLTYLNNQGFTQAQFNTSGFVVNVVDSGIDNATTSPNHFGLYTGGLTTNPSRVVFNRLEGTPNGASSTLLGCDGHGNINAHIIAGFIPSGAPFNAFPHADASGFRYGLGVAPFVKLGSTVIFDPNVYTFPNLISIESKAYSDNVRISSNSWGANVNGQYNVDSQTYDALVRDAQPAGAPFTQPGNQEMVIVFSAGNQGPLAGSVGSPGTAKNVITVGAAENVRALGGADGCNIVDSGADSANDMIGFSSRGPTADSRRKPEIVAPGTHITGGVAQAVNNPPATGQADPCFFGSGVCGGLNGAAFFPAGQEFYTASSGTSHAAPAVAGAAALLRQRFINAGQAPPSPAMTKAALMNTARHLTGSNANDNLWSNVQGMGEVNLTSSLGLFATPSVLRDQDAADTFTATGQTRLFAGTVADSGQPFRVTLAWTDAPGPTIGNAFVNNLDLEVTAGGQTYKGNFFSGASSVTGGNADSRNNAESVFIPAGVSGTFVVKVTAANIAGDGVPNSGGALDQDFALVISNGAITAQPVIAPAGFAVNSESCGTGNLAVDSGETVTVDLSLQNIGTTDTTNLVATLEAAGGVTDPSGPQTYGVLTNGGAAVSMPFTFTASGTCGANLVATLSLQDGMTNLGTVTFNFTLGTALTNNNAFQNTGAINIPNGAPGLGSGNAMPYPSQINVSGLTGTVTKVTVTLNGLNHTFPDDMDILLVGPTGQPVMLMSDAGGTTDITNANITFDDTGNPIPDSTAVTTGTYSPGDYGGGVDVFSAPVPAGPYPTSLSAFNGLAANGPWSLYIVDDADEEVGSITGGWSLAITTSIPICCNSSCQILTVNPPAVSGGTVGTFYTQTFTQGGGAEPVTFSIKGSIPPGLTFTEATLGGTPTQLGTFDFTVSALDSGGCLGSANYSLTISCPAIVVTPASLPNGIFGRTYSQTLGQTGGLGQITYTVIAGSLPPGLDLSGAGVLSGTPTATGDFSFTVQAQDGNNCTGSTAYTVSVTRLQFYPLPSPIRLLDTRPGENACDMPGQPIAAGTERLQLARRTCGSITIPDGAMAITGNITPVPSSSGFLTLFPSDASRPLVANSNFTAGETVNNVYTVGLGPDGSFKIYASSTTHVVVDVTGYYAPPGAGGLYFHPLPKPIRLLETRPGEAGCDAPGAPVTGGTSRTQPGWVSCGGVTIPTTAKALVGNATVVGPDAPGYLTLYPSSTAQPLVASGNYVGGAVINTPFTVGLGADGAFNIFALSTTHLVVDVLGYYSTEVTDANGTGLMFSVLNSPVRLLETRAGEPGCNMLGAQLAGGTEYSQQARGVCGGQTIPNDALGVIGNATVVNAQAGFLTLWPSNVTRPLVAASNFDLGQVVNRHFTVGFGPDGIFKIYSSGTTDLVVDVSGYFAP